MNARSLVVESDGLALDAGICVADEPRGIAVLLHGIPSVNPPEPDDTGYPGLAERFAGRGWSAMWADLRGVRGSEGFFSIEGWVRDAMKVVETARSLQPELSFLALVGSSAGGAVSAEATRRGAPVDAMALLGAPASWLSFAADPALGMQRVLADSGMPLAPDVLDNPAAWGDEFYRVTTEDSIVDVKVPILIVHGTADDVVPVEHAHGLAERAPDAELVVIDGALHVLRRDERAVERVLRWLDEVAP